MTNTPYQRRYRSRPPVQQPEKRPEKRQRRRFSLVKALLMLVGAATLLVLLMRYAIVPLLVALPSWLGGNP